MRRYWLFLTVLILLMASCRGRQASMMEEEITQDSVEITDAVEEDTLAVEYGNLPMPKAADELFDDFIFNFAVNKQLQRERIVFPLLSVNGSKRTKISKKAWKMDNFFMRQGYYTLLFDNEAHMEVVKDTSLNHAILERVYFNTHSVQQYIFERPKGAWMLTAINTIPISHSDNASFLTFYHRFVTDKEFQRESLSEEVLFVGPDPDDDFSQMEGIITPDTWEAFAPELPSKMIYNIVYGKSKKEGNTKLFVLRGIANGLELEMSFKKRNGKWLLTKLNT